MVVLNTRLQLHYYCIDIDTERAKCCETAQIATSSSRCWGFYITYTNRHTRLQ